MSTAKDQQRHWQHALATKALEIIIDLPFGFPINNIISINKGKRLEGEALMSALCFFQLEGRGDLEVWGEDDEGKV